MNVKSHSMLNTLFERMRMFAGNLTGGIDASERERLDLVLRGTNDGIWDWNLESGYVFFSPRWKSMLGYDEADILPRLDSWLELIHPDDLPETRRILEAHLNGGGEPYEIEHRLRHKDGSFRWILTRGAAVRDEQGRAIRMLGSHTDITARRRAEGIQAGQHQVLELLAAGGSLSQTLQRLLEVIEEQSPGMLGLVLLLDEDGQRLHIGAGPSLPQDYLESIEGLEIGPQVGSCGTASFTGTRVIVTDIARDPRWDNLRDLALQYNLRACWSEPVFSPSGRVIGTFAMYYKEPRSPTEAELRDIATGAHLAGVAIQRSRADAALLESERRLSTLMSNLPGMAYRCANDPSWPMSFVSRGSTVLTGYAPEELADGGKVAYGDLVHPDDRETTWDAVQTALASNDAYQITYRITTASGEEKWVWEQGSGVYDEDGALLALEGFVTDATERVLARQMLEQRVEERTHELSTLLKVSQDVASTLEPEALQGQVLDQLKAVVDYDGASVLVLQDQTLCVRAYRGPIPIEEALRLTFPLSEAGVNRAVIERREPIWIPDVRGDTPQARAFRQMAGGALTSTYNYVRSWLGVPLIARGQILGMLSLDHDQADYYTAQHSRLALAFANQVAVTIDNARLYRAAERRADEAQTLVTVQQAITGKHDQTSILQLIADEACRLTEAQRAMVFMLGNGALEMSVLSGYEDSSLLGYRMSLENSLTGRALRERRARRSADARNDPHADQDAVQRSGAHSVLTAPLLTRDAALGAITVLNKGNERDAFDDEDERVLQMLAAGVVIALENARLFEEEQDRRRIAEGLRDMLSVLNANTPLKETLHYIVAQAAHVLDAEAGVIFRLDEAHETIAVEAMAGMPPHLQRPGVMPLMASVANRASLRGEPVTVPDLAADMAAEAHLLDDLAPDARAWLEALADHFGAYISVPFVLERRVHGDITLYYRSPRSFSEEEVSLAVAFGEQASLAAQNAHLRIQAQSNAASEERTRLARELHDAVTQTLFSASLIAEVLPRLWEKSPEQGRQRLEELRELTRGALAEMRTLLLELRPATLTESSLPELLRQLGEAITGRSRLAVSLNIEGQAQLPPRVQVVFYRVAQETLNNITKHAGARHVAISLVCTAQTIALTLADDGRGFDPCAVAPNSLGLSIMRERTSEIGATLHVESVVGEGTTVRCVWPVVS